MHIYMIPYKFYAILVTYGTLISQTCLIIMVMDNRNKLFVKILIPKKSTVFVPSYYEEISSVLYRCAPVRAEGVDEHDDCSVRQPLLLASLASDLSQSLRSMFSFYMFQLVDLILVILLIFK